MRLGYVGEDMMRQGHYGTAEPLLKESLILIGELGNKNGIAIGLHCMALLCLRTKVVAAASVLFGAAAALRESLGTIIPPSEQAEYEDYLEQTPLRFG